jgi:hypothetical protein
LIIDFSGNDFDRDHDRDCNLKTGSRFVIDSQLMTLELREQPQ